jgi:4,5-DOPA dioxygenase extradiol
LSEGARDIWPTVFVSHGAPTLVTDPSPARGFLAGLGATLGRPRAILCVSAHWEARRSSLGGAAAPALIHDFTGFPEELYAQRYPAAGEPALAERAAALLAAAGLDTAVDPARGLDHGAWVPLKVMYPGADVPVVQLSLPTDHPDALFAMGHKLAALREEGVLVIGSGFMTHGLPNLTQAMVEGNVPGWSRDFDAWAWEAIVAGDVDTLASFRQTAPGMPYSHPSVEHFTPLFVTLGAATDLHSARTRIDGAMWGLSKRSLELV